MKKTKATDQVGSSNESAKTRSFRSTFCHIRLRLLALLLAGTSAFAADRPKVAVLPFQNFSNVKQEVLAEDAAVRPSRLPLLGRDLQNNTTFGIWKTKVDRYGELARSQVELALVALGEVDVVDRAQLGVLQRELDLNSDRGGDREVRENLAKRYGVDFFVFGQVLDIWDRSSSFAGYGVTRRSEQTQTLISLRVVQMAPEKVIYVTNQQGSFEIVTTPFRTATHSDPAGEAIRDAVRQLAQSSEFQKAFVARVEAANSLTLLGPNQVLVPIKSRPRGAMVEIDGHHIGVTPLKRRLYLNATHSLRLTKPGYRPWEGHLKVEEDSVVNVELEANQ